MRIPLSWLKEYIGSEISAATIDQTLTNIGIEVDAIEEVRPMFQGVIVARVETVEPHPNASNLKVTTVFDGKTTRQIVTAAVKCFPGMYVALAIDGAQLPGSKLIKPVDMRGVTSYGMFCSEAELALSDEDTALLEFSQEEIPLGAQLSEYVSDTILHISLTPNLGHCLSVYGIARELSQALSFSLKKDWKETQDFYLNRLRKECDSSKEMWEIDLFSDDGCLRYGLLSLQGVSVKPSPFKLRRRLALSGLRPVNAIVDALNLAMVEIGQPMHAFDAQAFSSAKRIVIKRENQEGLSKRALELIDGSTCAIPEGAIVIENGEKAPLAIAGVMGGLSSAVKESTDKVVIESAYFQMQAVRRASKTLGISSESSRRFERGVDPEGALKGLSCVLDYLKQQFPHLVVSYVGYEGREEIPRAKQILVRLSRAEKVLGFSVTRGDIESVFSRLGYPFKWISADEIEVQVPSYRHDVSLEIDLIEDIAKLIGYSSLISDSVPKFRPGKIASHPLYEFEKKARRVFVSLGLQECITCSLISPSRTELVVNNPIPKSAIASVQNPMSQEQSVLRPSLLPGLVDTMLRNIAQRQLSLSVFELGTIFLRSEGEIRERLAAAVLLYGDSLPHHFSQEAREFDFYDLKGIWEGLRASLMIDGGELQRSQISLFHPGRQAEIHVGGQQVGLLGEIHPKITQKLGISQKVYFMEVDLQDLLPHALDDNSRKVQPLPLYPSMERDWTVTLSKKISFSEIEKAIHRAAPQILESVELVTLFSNEKLGQDVHNVTVRMRFRDATKTLEQVQVDQAFQVITHETLRQLG